MQQSVFGYKKHFPAETWIACFSAWSYTQREIWKNQSRPKKSDRLECKRAKTILIQLIKTTLREGSGQTDKWEWRQHGRLWLTEFGRRILREVLLCWGRGHSQRHSGRGSGPGGSNVWVLILINNLYIYTYIYIYFCIVMCYSGHPSAGCPHQLPALRPLGLQRVRAGEPGVRLRRHLLRQGIQRGEFTLLVIRLGVRSPQVEEGIYL